MKTSKKGILLVNLGTPNSPTKKDVKTYLGEFLMDQYVVDLPQFFRFLLVKGIILNTRPSKSAEAYQKVWTKEGSPLLVYSEKLLDKLKPNFSEPIALAMRYGQPSIKEGLQNLVNQGCDKIVVLPLYPQYAMSTTLTVEEKVKEELSKISSDITLSFVPPFYNNPSYIQVLGEKIRKEKTEKNADYILFSYHGVPVRHLYKTTPTKAHKKQNNDCCKIGSETSEKCYLHQCIQTTEQLANYLNLEQGSYETAFQSRLGKDKWLEPATANRLEKLPKEGKKNILLVTPSFVSDCLETIEEIGMEGEEIFMENGGEDYNLVACLNDDDNWVKTVEALIRKQF